MHSSRRQRLADIAGLDPTRDAEEIYRRLVFFEFPGESKIGFQLAFYTPMRIPAIAQILVETGHFLRDTTKRSYDSALVMYEIIAGGFDSDRAKRMIALMAKLHDRPDIRPDDMTFVLLALIFEPLKVIDRYGWRPLTENERQAVWVFYSTLGERMNVRMPRKIDDAQQWYDSYTAQQSAPSPAATQLTAAILAALRTRMPAPLHPVSGQIMSALLADEAAATDLGLPVAGVALRATTQAAMRLRRALVAARPAPSAPAFTPGQEVRHAYPGGYRLEDVGPHG